MFWVSLGGINIGFCGEYMFKLFNGFWFYIAKTFGLDLLWLLRDVIEFKFKFVQELLPAVTLFNKIYLLRFLLSFPRNLSFYLLTILTLLSTATASCTPRDFITSIHCNLPLI